jgi:hypothetical protein
MALAYYRVEASTVLLRFVFYEGLAHLHYITSRQLDVNFPQQ